MVSEQETDKTLVSETVEDDKMVKNTKNQNSIDFVRFTNRYTP